MKLSLEFKGALGLLSALLAIELGWLWFMHTFEQKPVTERTPPSEEAQHNEFLAAFRVLEDLGFRVHEHDGLHLGELPEGGTLIIPSSREHLGASQNAALSEWVAAGGHLVVVPTIIEEPTENWLGDEGEDGDEPEPDDDLSPRLRDPLIEDLGVDVANVRDDAAVTHIVEMLRHGKTETVETHLPGQPEVGKIGPPMLVELDFYGDLPLWHLWGGDALYGLRVPLGDGALTVLGEMSFLHNRYLGQADNAVLLWELVRWNARAGDVWVVTQLTPPTLRELVLEYGWSVLASLLLLIAFFVWRHAPRFGPSRPDPEPIRRSLMEHIGASGLFLWRHGGDRGLIHACQRAVRNRVRWRTPGWRRLSEEKKRERIARLAKVDVERVSAVLSVHQVKSPVQFVEIVQQLERIRKRL